MKKKRGEKAATTGRGEGTDKKTDTEKREENNEA